VLPHHFNIAADTGTPTVRVTLVGKEGNVATEKKKGRLPVRSTHLLLRKRLTLNVSGADIRLKHWVGASRDQAEQQRGKISGKAWISSN